MQVPVRASPLDAPLLHGRGDLTSHHRDRVSRARWLNLSRCCRHIVRFSQCHRPDLKTPPRHLPSGTSS
eukprot:10409065-Heterocapsa_arctica.AAC.1